MPRLPQSPAPRATAAKPRSEAICSSRGLVYSAVRWAACPLCGAAAGQPCQGAPARADHLFRWLDAYSAARITRDQLTAEIVRLVVVTKWCVIPERSE